MALEKVLLSTSFAPVSHTCCRLVYAFPGNLQARPTSELDHIH